MDIPSHVEPLATLINRLEVMKAIDDGMREKRELHEALDGSRSTVDRAVRELEDAELLHRRNGQCEFTRYGELAYREFLETEKTYKELEPASALLSRIPQDVNIGLELVRDADITLVDNRAQVTPLPAPATSDCEQVHVLLPVLLPQQVEFFRQAATNDTTVVIVLDEDLLQVLSKNHPELLDSLQNSQIQVHAAAALPQITLTIIGSRKVWGWVHTASGSLQGYFTNTTAESVKSANLLFERFLSDSRSWDSVTA